MLTISLPMGAAQCLQYHMGSPQEAYYLQGVKEEGRCIGSAVKPLGLEPPVQREAFHNLLLGFSPDGKTPLVQNAGDPDRQCAWDLTFSAPKSVSVLWALAPEDIRRKIEQAHRDAVEKTLAYVEEMFGITRRGKGGAIKEQAKLIFATFQEGSSRALDPQIHTHALLVNLGLRRDGTSGALQTKNLFQAKMALGARYRQRLAHNLHQSLGLTTKPEKVGFHVQGVPKGLCRRSSKRRKGIEKVMRERGLKGALAAKLVTLETRPKKEHIAPEELFARWREVGRQYGWGPEQAERLVRGAERQAARERSSETQRSTQQAARDTYPSQPEEKAWPRSPSAQKDGEPLAPPPAKKAKQPEPVPEQTTHDQPPNADRPQPEHNRSPADPSRSEIRTPEEASKATNHANAPQGSSDRAKAAHSDKTRPRTDEARPHRLRSAPQLAKPNKLAQQGERFVGRVREGLARKTKVTPRWGRIKWRKNLGLAELRIQNRRLFRRAPQWSPVHGLALPALRFVPNMPDALAQSGTPAPRWGRIRWCKNLGLAEVRVQYRQLFPRAPQWSPVHGLALPALRFVPKLPAALTQKQKVTPRWGRVQGRPQAGLGKPRVQGRPLVPRVPEPDPVSKLKIRALPVAQSMPIIRQTAPANEHRLSHSH